MSLLFSEIIERSWWERWLSVDMSHVDLLLHAPQGAVLVETHGRRVQLTVLEPWIADRLLSDWPGRVISIEARNEPPPLRPPFGMATCVTLAKSVVGCFNPFIITPHALARWCVAQGGTDLGR